MMDSNCNFGQLVKHLLKPLFNVKDQIHKKLISQPPLSGQLPNLYLKREQLTVAADSLLVQ